MRMSEGLALATWETLRHALLDVPVVGSDYASTLRGPFDAKIRCLLSRPQGLVPLGSEQHGAAAIPNASRKWLFLHFW